MRRARVLVAGVAVASLAVAAWFLHRSGPQQAPAAAPAPTVTIKTASATRSHLARRITAYGDVLSGQVVGLGFPRAGQVSRLRAMAGRRVAKGTILATLVADPAVLETYRQAVTAADLAQREWTRQQELAKLQLATASQVATAEKAYRDAAGTVVSLKQTGGGQRESAVVAPFDGVVVGVAVAEGDRIAAGTSVLQFGRVDALRVLLGIEPAARGSVHVGTAVRFVPLTGVSADDPPIAGSIAEVQDIVDPKSLLLPALVRVRSEDGRALVPGMRVRATLDAGSVDAIAVPRDAVLIDDQGAYLFQVSHDKAARINVRTGLEADGMVAVDGLRDTSLPVVVLGNYELEDGMAVTVAANP